jgi:hypothetical protein
MEKYPVRRMVVTNTLFFLLLVVILLVIGFYFLNETDYFQRRRLINTGSGVGSVIESFEECVNTGFPILESHPRQCITEDGVVFTEGLGQGVAEMSLDEAESVAGKSECGDRLKDVAAYNPTTKTWWIDLDIEKEGCSPACVVFVETGRAEINWRCTGLVPE